MVYMFRHPVYTGDSPEFIGHNESEALDSLQSDFNIDLEDAASLIIDGHVWQEGAQ